LRKVILMMMVSLDGFIDGPNGEMDWIPFEEEFQRYVNGMHGVEVDTILYGKVAYQKTGKQDPDILVRIYPGPAQDIIEWVNKLDGMTKVVFSRTLTGVEGKNARLARGSVEEEVARLREEPGKDIQLIGGSALVSEFIRLGLIDEYRVMVAPVLLGGGKPLFKGVVERHNLQLTKLDTFPSGLVILHYRPR
jgi:dihydrofolate reductase